MDLGSVRVKIEGDSTKLQADLKAAEVAAANAGGKIAQTFNKSAGSMNNTTATIKQVASGITQTGEAAEKAGKKVQSFVGAIPGMGVAAERFIGLIPGLGQAMIAAFPVFGAVAFAAGLGRVAEGVRDIANEWDPVISAEKRAKEGAEEFGKTIVKIREELAKMANVRFAGAVGKAGGQADEAAQLESQKRLLQSQIQATKDEIARTAAAGAAGAGTMAVAGNFIPGMDTLGNRFTKGAKIDVATQTQKLVEFQNQLRQVEEQQSDLSVASLQAQSDKIDTARDKEQSKAERRAESDFAIREQRQREYESQLKAAEAAGDKEIAAKKHFNDAMAEQQQRWKKINIDAKDQRVTQSKIDVPVASRIAGPLAGALELKDAGIQTAQMQQAQIAEDQRLLNMAELMNVPLGTQLKMREQILQDQIALGQEQGRNVDNELIGLRKLQDQQDRMRQSPKATLQSGLSSVAGTDQTLGTKLSVTGVQLAANMVDGLASTLARAAVEGGKLGHMLRDVGKQLAMTAATSVLKMGLQAALQGILKLIPAFAGVATAQVGAAATSHATTSALNVASVMSYAAVGAAAAAAATAAIPIIGPAAAPGVAAAIYAQISSFAPLAAFADGGRPEPGKMALVGERGPELFIPDQAGRIVPNHMLNGGAGLSFPSASSSGGGINIGSITANGVNNPREFVREVARQLPAYLKSTNPKYSPASR